MSNLFSIFTRKEPCKYMHVERTEFIRTYMNDQLHSFGCVDCQRRFATYFATVREAMNADISEMFRNDQEVLE